MNKREALEVLIAIVILIIGLYFIIHAFDCYVQYRGVDVGNVPYECVVLVR